MAGIVRVILSVALLYDLVADLEQRFLKPGNTFAGFDFDVHRSIAEFIPELGIGDQPARLFARQARPFRDPAEGVVHCPVQPRKKRHHLLPASHLVIFQSVLRRTHRHIHQEIAVDRLSITHKSGSKENGFAAAEWAMNV